MQSLIDQEELYNPKTWWDAELTLDERRDF